MLCDCGRELVQVNWYKNTAQSRPILTCPLWNGGCGFGMFAEEIADVVFDLNLRFLAWQHYRAYLPPVPEFN